MKNTVNTFQKNLGVSQASFLFFFFKYRFKKWDFLPNI